METLPFVDAHEVEIAAAPEVVFAALEAQVARTPLLGSARAFPRRESAPPATLELAGAHRFARYALRFELLRTSGGTRVRAITHAEFFPGAGRVYRALVIGSGAHAQIVKRFLRRLGSRVSARRPA